MKKSKLLIIISSVCLLSVISISCNHNSNDADVLSGNTALNSNRIKVTFDLGDGHFKDKKTDHSISYNVRKGLTYKYVKTHAPKSDEFECLHRTFKFWSIDGVTEVKDDLKLENNITIYALYDSAKLTVTFDGNGGNVIKNGATITSDSIDYGTKWKDIKSKYSATFDTKSEVKKSFSHFTIGDTSAVIYDEYEFIDAITLKANYSTDKVILTVDPNGGAFDAAGNEVTPKSEIIDHHTNWQDKAGSYAIKKAPTGYTFKTFERYDETNKKWVEIGDSSYLLDSSQTIRAKYSPTKFPITAICTTGGKFTSSSSASKTITNVEYNSDFDDIKDQLAVTAESDYVFTNYTNTKGDVIGSGYKFTNSSDEKIIANFASKGQSVNLNIDPNGGTIDSKKVVVAKDTLWSAIKADNTPTAPDGYTFDYYTYVNSEGVATKVDDSYKFTADSSFTAHYKVNEPATRNFSTDSWTSIATYANQGLTKLKAVYDVTDTFVGKTRTVTIDDVNYTVRVIGEDVDYIDENGNNKATLTFEFVNVLPYYVSYSNYGTNNNTWETSNLRQFLNNHLYNKLPTDLKSNIVEVKKYTYDYEAEDAGSVIAYDEKLFPLSAREMGYDSTYPDSEPKSVKKEGLGTNHEDRYAAYSQSSKTTDNGKKAIINGVETSDYVTYWTRSPDVKTSLHAWSISGAYEDSSQTKKAGGMLGEYDLNDDYYTPIDVRYAPGIAPAFCIGKTTNKVSFVGKNYKIGSTLPCYYDKTSFIKGQTGVSISNITADTGYTLDGATIDVVWNGASKTKGTDYTFTLDGSGKGTFALVNAAEAYDITITITPKEAA